MLVLVQLKNEQYVIGKMNIVEENSIEIEDAMIINYAYHLDSPPTVYLTKYCIFTESTTVTMPNDEIRHVFKDPVPDIIGFYRQAIKDKKNRPLETERKRARKSKVADEDFLAYAERMHLDDGDIH